MQHSYKSDVGMHRELNEDSCFIENFEDYSIYIIADGMGGHQAGEVASNMAVEYIASYVRANFEKGEELPILNEAFKFANNLICDRSEKDDSMSNMGTTCDAVLISDGIAYIGHVGDSRVYHMSDNIFSQVTRDHSLYNDLVESGNVKKEEIDQMKVKNIITRALGGERNLLVDQYKLKLKAGDYIFLCSDGVSNQISDKELESTILSSDDLSLVTDSLIEKANAYGGFDNSTVILVRMEK